MVTLWSKPKAKISDAGICPSDRFFKDSVNYSYPNEVQDIDFLAMRLKMSPLSPMSRYVYNNGNYAYNHVMP